MTLQVIFLPNPDPSLKNTLCNKIYEVANSNPGLTTSDSKISDLKSPPN